jgi:hypothetical protein
MAMSENVGSTDIGAGTYPAPHEGLFFRLVEYYAEAPVGTVLGMQEVSGATDASEESTSQFVLLSSRSFHESPACVQAELPGDWATVFVACQRSGEEGIRYLT